MCSTVAVATSSRNGKTARSFDGTSSGYPKKVPLRPLRCDAESASKTLTPFRRFVCYVCLKKEPPSPLSPFHTIAPTRHPADACVEDLHSRGMAWTSIP